MATLGIKSNWSSVSTDIIIVWYEAANPLAEVDRIVKPAPHLSGDVVTALNLNFVDYIFRFYETPDGSTFGTLLDSWNIQPIATEAEVEKFEYVVNRGQSSNNPYIWADPADGDTQIIDERLRGGDLYLVYSSVGLRHSDEINILPTGGIELALPGDVFTDGEKWTVVMVTKRQITGGSGNSASAVYSAVKLIPSDDTFGATHYDKICLANFSATIGTTTFPALSSIPSGKKARFSTFTGAQRYWALQFNSGDTVTINGQAYNRLLLAKDEEVEIFFESSGAYVVHYTGRLQQVGRFLFSNNPNQVGTAICDGSQHNIVDYPRLIDELPAEMLVSYATWNISSNVTVGSVTKTYYPNRGKFALDQGAGTFRFPDLRGQTFRGLLYTDGTPDGTRLAQGAGGVQAQEIIQHGHRVNTSGPGYGADPGGALVRSGHGGDGYGGSGTGVSVQGPYIERAGGTEQRVDNIGQYALVTL